MTNHCVYSRFSLGFPFEGEFWHCHFAVTGSLKPDVSGQIGVRIQENMKSPIFESTFCRPETCFNYPTPN